MCNNFWGSNNNCCGIIILIVLLLVFCGNGCGTNSNNGCGCC